MSVYVLDANMISYILRGQETVINNAMSAISNGHDIIISPIAYYEVKRGLEAVGSKKRMREFIKLYSMLGVGQLDNNVLDTAVDIWVKQKKSGRATGDADIFIAAFCVNHNFALVTHNTKHFEDVDGLTITDWCE
ncbi:MAG: PIN domain-containing protein [Oscillospiraceae bacterium]|jgi:predicted nucleic acid-binding protein|nr:PIN domain-containing protein [Oscillospiraceae bacterium]